MIGTDVVSLLGCIHHSLIMKNSPCLASGVSRIRVDKGSLNIKLFQKKKKLCKCYLDINMGHLKMLTSEASRHGTAIIRQ